MLFISSAGKKHWSNDSSVSEFRNITKRTELDIWEDTSVGSLFARQPLGKASLTFWKNSKNVIQSTFATKMRAKPFYDMHSGTDLLRACSVNPLHKGIGRDWMGLRGILTCWGFNPSQPPPNQTSPEGEQLFSMSNLKVDYCIDERPQGPFSR